MPGAGGVREGSRRLSAAGFPGSGEPGLVSGLARGSVTAGAGAGFGGRPFGVVPAAGLPFRSSGAGAGGGVPVGPAGAGAGGVATGLPGVVPGVGFVVPAGAGAGAGGVTS